MVDVERLVDWVDRWAGTYPEQHDERIAHLAERAEFGVDDWLAVVDWKFHQQANRQAQAERAVRGVEDPTLRHVSRAAFESPDDVFAMRIIQSVTGVGPALGSALLMAGRPDRFTVYDERASSTLRCLLGRLGWDADDVNVSVWGPYLRTCRRIAELTGRSLRHVDRALYVATDEARTL